MGFSIRTARKEDAASIVDLLNPIIEEGIHTTMDALLSLDDQLAFIRAFPQRGVFHVAICDQTQRVAGLQDVVPVQAGSGDPTRDGEISTFVSLDSPRKGIGRNLCQATFQSVRALGFTRLRAVIRADNPRAIAFYQSQGFRVIGRPQGPALVRGQQVAQVLAEKIID